MTDRQICIKKERKFISIRKFEDFAKNNSFFCKILFHFMRNCVIMILSHRRTKARLPLLAAKTVEGGFL
jgi:hypothetical protein